MRDFGFSSFWDDPTGRAQPGTDDYGFEMPMPRRRRRRRSPRAPEPLTPEEEKSLLDYSVGGLAWIGESLDKLGAGTRGLVAGKPEQLLNWIPFSDTLGITDESGWFADSLNVLQKDDRVSGRDLLELAGAPENKPGLFNSAEDALYDVGGFAAEVALDPLTWIAGGASALSKAGKAATGAAGKTFKAIDQAADAATALKEAKKIAAGADASRLLGTTPVARADEIRQGLRGLFSIKAPFAKEPIMTVGAGNERVAKLVEAMYYGKFSPVVPLRGLFSKIVGGVQPVGDAELFGFSKWGLAQKARDKAYHEFANGMALASDVAAVAKSRLPELEKLWTGVAEHARTMGDDAGFADFDEFARYVAEQTGLYRKAPEDIKSHILRLVEGGSTKDVEPFAEATSSLVDLMLDMKDRTYGLIEKLGGHASWLEDAFVEHFPRRMPGFNKYKPYARKEFLKGIPRGTLTLQRASRDKYLSATARLTREEKNALTAELRDALSVRGVDVADGAKLQDLQKAWLRSKYFEPALQEATQMGMSAADVALAEQRLFTGLSAGTEVMGRKLADDMPPIIDDLTEWLTKLPPEVKETGVFDRGFMEDWSDHLEYAATTASNLRSIHHLMRQGATTEYREGLTSVRDAWRGIDGQVAGSRKGPITTPKGRDTFVSAYLDQLKQSSPSQYADVVSGLDESDPTKFLAEASDRIYVDPRVSQAAARYLDVAHPKHQGWFSKVYDGATRAFKWGVTTPWPAFHVRNLLDGTWRNYMRVGADTYGLRDLVRAQTDFAAMGRHGGNLDSLPFLKEGEAIGAFETKFFPEVVGKEVRQNTTFPRNPLDALFSGAEAGWTGREGGKVRKAMSAAAGAGEETYRYVEFHNRYMPYAAARHAGMSPSQAKALADEIQYVYGKKIGGALQDTFGDKMAKVFPFWGFMRENIPYQLKQLFEHPGGGHAQTVRMIGLLSQEGGDYQPGWLKERMAVRLGGPDNQAQIMQQFGLSIEDLSRFAMKGTIPDWKRVTDRVVADMNPLLGLPISMWTQREPYTGRSLKELEPLLGLGPGIDSLVYSSPAARAVSTGRMLLDKRKSPIIKAINALTGVKISTQDLDKAKLYELERMNRDLIDADPVARTFTEVYVPKEDRDRARASTIQALERSRKITALLKALRAAREKEKGG